MSPGFAATRIKTKPKLEERTSLAPLSPRRWFPDGLLPMLLADIPAPPSTARKLSQPSRRAAAPQASLAGLPTALCHYPHSRQLQAYIIDKSIVTHEGNVFLAARGGCRLSFPCVGPAEYLCPATGNPAQCWRWGLTCSAKRTPARPGPLFAAFLGASCSAARLWEPR